MIEIAVRSITESGDAGIAERVAAHIIAGELSRMNFHVTGFEVVVTSQEVYRLNITASASPPSETSAP